MCVDMCVCVLVCVCACVCVCVSVHAHTCRFVKLIEWYMYVGI